MTIRIWLCVGLALAVAACGGEPNLACDEVQPYQTVTPHKRVEVPEGLDDLDPVREMSVPEASPRPERQLGSPCIDLPPGATASRDAAKAREAEEADAAEDESSDDE